MRLKVKAQQSALAECNKAKAGLARQIAERRIKEKVAIEADPALRSMRHIKDMLQELPCQLQIVSWMGRVEGKANLPPGTFKQVLEVVREGRFKTEVPLAYQQQMKKAIANDPPPNCCMDEIQVPDGTH